MCQLLGMNSHLPASLTLSFSGFSQRGGSTDHHADGWGIAFFESEGSVPGKAARHFVDKESAATSPIAKMLRSYPIKSHNVVAHVRKATIGEVRLENCHPFVRELWGRYWFFAHNGDLKDFTPHLHGAFKPVGDTDSELAFCWLLQELNKSHAGVPSVQELTHTLRELVPRIAKHGTFNFLMSNGQALWAHASTKLCYVLRQHPFTQVQLKDEDLRVDLAEFNGPDDRLAIVVTEPLTTNENWVVMAPGEMKVFMDGCPLL
ncbi:class II glutamine amidotransferase [Candidatus Aalborgicola defluviihabitans]|uniref:class II glutamine amidotransferase n=1 Tax=Candidatus Aalborgicola defluviihabitans TaxID=3386187 RepID=UPI001E11FE92|nr:class II glutamine amidotransferase [Burkholderiales bacterium]MBK7279514.1 class II glutamine amidotransferase [Burkholderiales bacterium]MBK7312791.1 class II glutamine amidotransferase [Burkholderiales bacterium]MBL0243607.1 class II glutamine amidotransferase [Rhodoferax sp.]